MGAGRLARHFGGEFLVTAIIYHLIKNGTCASLIETET